MLKLAVRIALIAVTCILCTPAFAIADSPKRIDIPAGELTTALRTLADQSGAEFVYSSDQLKGVKTRGVHGEYTTERAVTKLLEGTNLGVRIHESGAFLITPSHSAPLTSTQDGGSSPSALDATGSKTAWPGWNGVHLAQATAGQTRDETQVTGPPGGASARSAESARSQLEEIVVSARRREESIQNVPISIAAFSGADLAARQVVTTQGLTELTPNLQFSPVAPSSGNNTAGVIFIRGVGATDFIASTDPGVGFYVDGVYFARSAGTAVSLLDVDHIEVLRGPQGTLFGRNTLGGAIQVITNKPSFDRTSGSIEATFGDFSRREGIGVLNLRLSDTLAIRLAAILRTQDGYVTNVLTGRDLGDVNTFGARLSVLWKPTDSFELLWASDYMSDHTNGTPNVFGGINTSAPFVQFASLAAGCPGYTGPPAPVPENTDPRCANNQYLSLGPYKVASNAHTHSQLDMWGSQLTATWHIADWITLKSITGYRETQPYSVRDADNTPLIVLETINRDDMKQFTQELQFLGDAFDSRLHWQAGAYYFHETDPQDYPAYLPLPPVGGLNTAAFIKNESYALFTQESFDITKELQLTVGVRYTNDTKEATPDFRPAPPNAALGYGDYGIYIVPYPNESMLPLVCLAPPPVVAMLPCSGSNTYLYAPVLNKQTSSKVTPMASLQYRWTPALMSYFSYSEGYKSGGFNTRIIQPVFSPTDPTGRQQLPSYGPETVDSYELGAKFGTSWLRLSAALFNAKYRDIQIEVREGAAPVVQNAGDATIKGFELEGTLTPLPPASIDFGVGYTDFHYDSLSSALLQSEATLLPGGGRIDLTNQQAYTPRWSGNLGLSYRFETSFGTFTPRVDGAFRSLTYFDAANTLSQPSYEVYNASLRFSDSKNRFSATVGVTNFTDKAYRVSGASAYYAVPGYVDVTYAPPRMWFISGSASF
jgi:iron complex outermembrane receptor protein